MQTSDFHIAQVGFQQFHMMGTYPFPSAEGRQHVCCGLAQVCSRQLCNVIFKENTENSILHINQWYLGMQISLQLSVWYAITPANASHLFLRQLSHV
jgi:hypothetical protein